MTVLRSHLSTAPHDRTDIDVTPLAGEASGRGHDFDGVEEHGAGFVLRCTCGWTSPPSGSAEVVGTAWDQHRRAVGASDW